MSTLLIIGLKNAILVVPLALAALAAGRWSRRPALTHLLWTLVLVKMLTPPLIHVPIGWRIDVESWVRHEQPTRTPKPTPPVVPSGRVSSSAVAKTPSPKFSIRHSTSRKTVAPIPATPRSIFSTVSGALSWSRLWQSKFEILGAIWLAGSLVILLKVVRRSYQFHRFLNLVEKRDDSLGPRAAELAARARIGIAPRVVVVDSVVSPMLWGMGRRATLVFPAKLVARLSPAELDALLLHELAHFARGDHWVRVLELACSVLYWWHPVIWCARHELEIAEEQCCDAWVVERQTGGRLSYAEALLATIDFLHEPATARPPVACGLGEVPFLRTRLTQIMRGQVAARLPNGVTLGLFAAGLLCAPLEPSLWANGTSDSSSVSRRWNQAVDAGQLRATPPVTSQVPTESISVTIQGPKRESITLPGGVATTPGRAVAGPPRINLTRLPLAPASHFASAHSPNGKYRFEARVGQQTRLVMGTNGTLNLSEPKITCVAFAPDSRTFASGHEDLLVRIGDCDTGAFLRSYKGCDSPIKSVQISPDGTLLAAGTQTGRVVVWEVETGEQIRRIDEGGAEATCVRWSVGNRLAVSFGAWNNQEELRLLVWVPLVDQVVLEQSLEQPVGALEWLPHDESLLLASWDGYVRTMNVATGLIDSEIQIRKDRVSAAAWSANCPLLETNNLSVMKTSE